MHRFRKKSDAKRAQVPEHLVVTSSQSPQPALSNISHNSPDSVPALPPVSDFRTSLILPSLSKRFTLLRTPNGDPVSLDDIRTKIAEQRSRGAEHQIFEEEEDMIVDALAQLRTSGSPSSVPPAPSNTAVAFSSGGTFAVQQDSSVNLLLGGAQDLDYPSSIASGISPSISSTMSLPYTRSPPSSSSTPRTSGSPRYSSKRMSNNMFSSGRLHDTSYLRSVSKASVPSSRSTTSLTGSDSHGGSTRSTRSARGAEVNPGQIDTSDQDGIGDVSTSPEKASLSQTLSLSPLFPASAVPSRLAKDFTLQQVRRTSLALEEVIRGIEEEVEETIMVPRTSLSRASTVNSRAQSPKVPDTPSAIGTPIPWMTDEARVDDRDHDELILPDSAQLESAPAPASPSLSPGPYNRPGTASPTPRLPGYIPGMTRPLTPRDIDSDRDDGATGYSTTPRARSPALPQFSHHPHSFSPSRHNHHTSLSSDGQSILPPSILRSSRGSGQQQLPPMRTASPGYGGRSRGNSTSSPQVPSPAPSPVADERFKNELLMRRPLSPLVGTTMHGGGSRPGTPSSPGPWPSSPLAQVHMTPSRESDTSRPGTPGHSRNGSLNSTTSARAECMPATIPLSGPALPDSPFLGSRQGSNGGALPTFGWEQGRNGDANVSSGTEDLGQPRPSAVAAKIAARAPTPVHTHSRTPPANESGHDPILLHRTVSRRSQKRMQSPTPPPQAQTQTLVALRTPSSSSNSSNLNVSANMYSGASPLFPPMLNTSASSLVSVGSSYHSWADETGKKNGWDQLVDYESQRSAWQEILNTSGREANKPKDVSETSVSPDKELHSLTGLTKGDLVVVQSRLVADAQARRGFDPPRSPTRRRRISASRGSFSAAQTGRESGTNSPAPSPRQPTPVTENGHASPLPRHSPENTSRANALLDSVLNSIQSQTVSSTPPSSDVPTAEPASTTDEDSSSRFPSVSSSGRDSHEDDASALRLKALADAISITEQPPQVQSGDALETTTIPPETSQTPEEDSGEATEVPASQGLWRTPQPQLHGDTVQLVRDVSRRATAATSALKSPSQANVADPDSSARRRTMRRIDLQKIGNPHLVSSSASVDAVPITPAQPSSLTSTPSLKLSQRFKRLRGTLRTKPSTPNGDEVTPFALPTLTNSAQSPYSASSTLLRLPSPAGPAQTLRYMPHQAIPVSATEQGNFKVTVPPPPASAGPGLKSFIMARFRKSRKEPEVISGDRPGHQSSESTSPVSPSNDRMRHGVVSPPHAPAPSPPITRQRRSQDSVPVDAERARSPTPDPATLNQLFNAASELGLDQGALNELLARSTSNSSRKATWPSTSAAAFNGSRSNSVANRGPVPRARETNQGRSFDQPRTPDQAVYKAPTRPTPVNRYPEGEVVRRTIIFASDNPSVSELDALVRKNSSPGRPQRSDSAVSLHSTTTGPREPLVPKLLSNSVSAKSTSANEPGSFYDTYSHEQSFSNVQNGSTENLSPLPGDNTNSSLGEQGQGPALEVLQLSNGQVIWSVLDSLRAADEDDSESMFRRSMASSRGNDDDLEVRFKEHRRWSSKGSNFSQVSHSSRRRQVHTIGGARPETKLYKTNSSTIGRLIEDLSKNLDSGSFNFMHPAIATPSTSTYIHSDASNSSHQVERDLDALLREVINPR